MNKRLTAPTLEVIASSALCMREVVDGTELAEPDIAIIAPTIELSAPFLLDITRAGMDVAPMEQMSSWESEQTWSRHREVVEVVHQYKYTE